MKIETELMLIAFVLASAALAYARYVVLQARNTEQHEASFWDHLKIGAPKLAGACLCGDGSPDSPIQGKGGHITREEFTRRMLRATFKKTRSNRAIGRLWTLYAKLERKILAIQATGSEIPARLEARAEQLASTMKARIDKIAWKRSVVWSFCLHCDKIVRKSKLSEIQKRFTSVSDTDVSDWVKSTIGSKLSQWYQLEVAGPAHPIAQPPVDAAVQLLQEEE